MTKIFAVLKIITLLLWCCLCVPPQIIVLLFHKGKYAYVIPQFWHRGVAKIIGLKIEVLGTPIHNKQIMYISNHLSYLDIPVIGSILKASFIAKEDIAHWPVIGFLSTVQQTAFISRNAYNAKKVANALDKMVKDGKSLILFPEGTSTVGTSVLPFKSSLFSLATPKDLPPIPIQPFVIELISVNGKSPTTESRDLYAWYGDMDFAPHIWDYLQNKGATIRLTFLDKITPDAEMDRKTLSKMVEDKISAGLPPV